MGLIVHLVEVFLPDMIDVFSFLLDATPGGIRGLPFTFILLLDSLGKEATDLCSLGYSQM